MTKSDLNQLAIGGGIGLAAFLAFWFYGRRTAVIREILPAQVKWEGQ
jgi:hypothetical protein